MMDNLLLAKKKAEQACEILPEMDIDLWLIWVRETSQMADPVLDLVFSGDLVWQSALLFKENKAKSAIVGDFDADAVSANGIFEDVIPYTQSIREALIRELDRTDPREIAVNYSQNDVAADGLTVGMHMLLLDYLKGTPYVNRLVSAEGIISKLRGRKIDEEVARIERAVQVTEKIFKDAEDFVKVGMTEKEIHSLFHKEMERHDVKSAWNEDQNPAVDAGPYKQFSHSGPTHHVVKDGHLLHFDFGVRWNGYCSDIQRMFFFGKKSEVPTEVIDAFETVRDAIQAAGEFIRPGAVGYEVDTIAREFVKGRGYREYQHALGHQIGRHTHDGGTLLGPKWERYGESPLGVVEVGNVFTLELSVTTDNYGQVSLEEDILITRQGCRFLSTPQEELICIG